MCSKPNKLSGDEIDVGYKYMQLTGILMLAVPAETGNPRVVNVYGGAYVIWQLLILNWRLI